MKIKHQLALFNLLTKLLILIALWFSLPVLVKRVVYSHIDKNILEKKKKFITHLDKEEINDFINRNDSTETFASFSTLHDEFLQLYRAKDNLSNTKSRFVNESRIIEEEQNEYRVFYYNFNYEKNHYVLEIGNSLSEIDELTFSIRAFIIVVFFTIIVFTFLADTFIVEYLLRPFYAIINTKMRHVNEPDTFNYTPINAHSSEFEELDTVLNQMMERINDLFQKEKQFIANVSHELLTPISVLKNRFENLLQNESIDDEGIDKIVSSLKTLDLLKRIIHNLLLISKIDNHQFESKETISINSVVYEIITELEDRVEEKQILIDNKLTEDFVFHGNKTLIHIMLHNLILNAIKYNVKKGNVIISSQDKQDEFIINISDTGIGMSSQQQVVIFDRFSRVSFDQEGQGLGLAIVESIAKFHNLSLNLESSVNKGTTFSIIFHK